MSKRRFFMITAATLLVSGICKAEETPKVEDFFPPEVKIEVKRKPLEADKKAYLKKFNIPDKTIKLYGDIFVAGYGTENFRWGDIKPDDLGSFPIDPKSYDTSGMKKFAPLPAGGTHPRLLFTNADREEHLKRLTTTKSGKEAMKILQGYTDHLKGKYDKNADYAKPDTFKGSFGVHGFLELFRAKQDGWEARSQGKSQGRLSPGLCVLEAYRCWLYQDDEGMKKAAKAFETLIRDGLKQYATGNKRVMNFLGGFNTSYMYDIAYNQLTDEQKRLFRSVIIAAWYNRNNYGMFQNAENTTSNWSTFGYQFFGRLGIEGEPGYNELAYEGWKRTMQNYFTYGWFKAGTCFEAFGKNQLGGDIMYGMAMRGDKIAAHPHVLACLRDYLPHAIVPWGNYFIAYDRWGGMKGLNTTDLLPLKKLFPNDKKIDWVYRKAVGEDYSLMLGNHRLDGWGNGALKTIVFASDFDESNDDPSKLFDTESFLDPQRGLMITRSDWGKDALYMQMHTRGFSGGHVFSDRSSFLLGGLGRMWVPNGSLSYRTRENSVVTVDGKETSNNSPARLANYKRTPMGTFSTADLRPTWNFKYIRLVRDGEAKVTTEAANAALEAERQNSDRHFNIFKLGIELCKESFNDMALEKEDKPQFNCPQFAKPHWLKPGAVAALVRKKNKTQFSKAFRSAGMIRGKNTSNSYALILDDWKAVDGERHLYDWSARVAPDLTIIKYQKYNINPKNGRKQGRLQLGQPVYRDILLASMTDIEHSELSSGRYVKKLKKGAKVMLVRVLEMNIPEQKYWDSPHIQPVADGVRLMQTGDETANMLVFKAVTKEPKFKVMMYLTKTKDGNNNLKNEPVTTWDKDKKNLTVKIGDQTDLITFTEADEKPTTFTVKRQSGDEFAYGLDDYLAGRK